MSTLFRNPIKKKRGVSISYCYSEGIAKRLYPCNKKKPTPDGASISPLLRRILLLNWRFFRIRQSRSKHFNLCG